MRILAVVTTAQKKSLSVCINLVVDTAYSLSAFDLRDKDFNQSGWAPIEGKFKSVSAEVDSEKRHDVD